MTRDWDQNPMWNSDPGSSFNVEFWPGVIIKRWIVTSGHNSTLKCDPGHDSTLNCDPRSWFHVELWPQVWSPRWIGTPNHNSTLNCDLRLGSQFNVEFWPGIIIQYGILTWGPQFNVEFWPSTYLLPVELRLKKVSKFNSAIKIQQLRRVEYWPWVSFQWRGQNFILHRPYYNVYMTGGVGFLDGVLEWFRRPCIIVTPCLWLTHKLPRFIMSCTHTKAVHSVFVYKSSFCQ